MPRSSIPGYGANHIFTEKIVAAGTNPAMVWGMETKKTTPNTEPSGNNSFYETMLKVPSTEPLDNDNFYETMIKTPLVINNIDFYKLAKMIAPEMQLTPFFQYLVNLIWGIGQLDTWVAEKSLKTLQAIAKDDTGVEFNADTNYNTYEVIADGVNIKILNKYADSFMTITGLGDVVVRMNYIRSNRHHGPEIRIEGQWACQPAYKPSSTSFS